MTEVFLEDRQPGESAMNSQSEIAAFGRSVAVKIAERLRVRFFAQLERIVHCSSRGGLQRTTEQVGLTKLEIAPLFNISHNSFSLGYALVAS